MNVKTLSSPVANIEGNTMPLEHISVVSGNDIESNEYANVKTSDSNKPVANIAYQMIVSGCNLNRASCVKMLDLAAVLKHSI